MGDVEFDLGYTPDGGAVDNFVKFMVWGSPKQERGLGEFGSKNRPQARWEDELLARISILPYCRSK